MVAARRRILQGRIVIGRAVGAGKGQRPTVVRTGLLEPVEERRREYGPRGAVMTLHFVPGKVSRILIGILIYEVSGGRFSTAIGAVLIDDRSARHDGGPCRAAASGATAGATAAAGPIVRPVEVVADIVVAPFACLPASIGAISLIVTIFDHHHMGSARGGGRGYHQMEDLQVISAGRVEDDVEIVVRFEEFMSDAGRSGVAGSDSAIEDVAGGRVKPGVGGFEQASVVFQSVISLFSARL